MLDGEMNHHTGPGPESRRAESYQQDVDCARCDGEDGVSVAIDGANRTVGPCSYCDATDWTEDEADAMDTRAVTAQREHEDGLAAWDGGMI